MRELNPNIPIEEAKKQIKYAGQGKAVSYFFAPGPRNYRNKRKFPRIATLCVAIKKFSEDGNVVFGMRILLEIRVLNDPDLLSHFMATKTLKKHPQMANKLLRLMRITQAFERISRGILFYGLRRKFLLKRNRDLFPLRSEILLAQYVLWTIQIDISQGKGNLSTIRRVVNRAHDQGIEIPILLEKYKK